MVSLVLLSKDIARLAGLKRYFTGKTCKNGHVSERYVNSGICCECGRSEKAKEQQRAFYHRNKESEDLNHSTWIERNRSRYNEYMREWHVAHPEYTRARNAKRRAAQKNATPVWASKKAIEKFYADAVRLTIETGILYVVDHIVPLQSEFVCGLHVEFNLQVITADENLTKYNRYWPDIP